MIYNPIRVPDFPALRARIEAHMARAGWAEPLWLGTTVDDPGAGMCAEAAEEKADLVIVVRRRRDGVACVAQALAGTDMPLALLPSGTGNLLARNLGIPLDDEDGGAAHRRCPEPTGASTSPRSRTTSSSVMAGLGFDAAMMRDASEGLKRAIGWPAYVVSGARHLRGRGIRVRITLDDGKPFSRRVRTAVVGNVGKLLAGIPLLPDAEPDDGVLDVVLIAPGSIVGWARVAGRVMTRRGQVDRRVERFRAQHVLLETGHPTAAPARRRPDRGRAVDGHPDRAGRAVRARPHAALTSAQMRPDRIRPSQAAASR